MNKGNQCYYRRMNKKSVNFEESQLYTNFICVIADDTYVFIFLSPTFRKDCFLFEERTYHNVNRFSDYTGAEICEIFPCFHAVTDSDYTNPFSRRSKVQFFEQMVAAPSLAFLFSSMKSKKSLDIGGYKFVTGC